MTQGTDAKGLDRKGLERTFKALANGRRIAIVRCLKSKKEASVSAIAEEIKLSFRATSKHLALLAAAGIVEREQRSLQMFYSLANDLSGQTRHLLKVV
jgi:DNA-binding transcriptional ArsR family regulator